MMSMYYLHYVFCNGKLMNDSKSSRLYLHPGLRRLRRKRHRQWPRRLVDRPLRVVTVRLLEKRVRRVSDLDFLTNLC